MKNKQLSDERNKLLASIMKVSELPLFVLAIVWLALVIADLTDRSNSLLETVGVVIWVIFIIDFALKLFIASSKLTFLRKNILTIISLIVPAFRLFRVFRIFRLIRLSRGLRLVRVVGSFNRGMRSLANTLQKRAVIYVVLLSVIVILLGSAGLYAFERSVNPGFETFGSALWWTSMLVMSMGTENWPITSEGRVLTILIAIYGLAVFGYVAATIASFFIDKDAEDKLQDKKHWDDLKNEILLLKNEIHAMRDKDTSRE